MGSLNQVWVVTRTPTPRNKYIIIAAMASERDSWDRVLKHKNADTSRIALRPMTAAEAITADKAWRMMYYKYESWEVFINEEWNITQDPSWIAELVAFSGRPLSIQLEPSNKRTE